MSQTHSGSCYCGAVTIDATGEPLNMGYCHCDACRRYSGMPVNSFTLWKPEQVKITQGGDLLTGFQSSEMSNRKRCSKCGGNVIVDHASLGLVDIPAGILSGFTFKPTVHLNYEETVLPMTDGLPKLRDFPAEIGGSGEAMPE